MGYLTLSTIWANATDAWSTFLRAQTLLAKFHFVIQFSTILAYAFVNASILLSCCRIFVTYKGSAFDCASKVVMVLIILWLIGFLIHGLYLYSGSAYSCTGRRSRSSRILRVTSRHQR
ncbi:hypothetical protein F5Y18DRAFT_210494 [Xylariaceae sp. FL1019]|nr:hypothetical protein F5Y18DRAFT_210494 [Xylariaceae sp. FL1019]